MNNFFLILNFLAADNVFGHVGTAFQVIASCFALILWVPPLLDVFKLNKTYGLSEKFMLFGIVAGVLFSFNGLLMVIEGLLKTTKDVSTIAFGAITLFMNVFSGTCNFFFLGKKRSHMRAAAEKGLSEMDYYNSYLAK